MSDSWEGKERSAAPWISLAVLGLVVVVVGGWFLRPRQPPGVDEQALLDTAEDLVREGDAAFAAWNAARRDSDLAQLRRERGRAVSLYTRALNTFGALLSGYRDPDTGELRPEYVGYEERLQHCATRLVDLSRG